MAVGTPILDSIEIVLNFSDGNTVTIGREIQENDKVSLENGSFLVPDKPRIKIDAGNIHIDVIVDEFAGTTSK